MGRHPKESTPEALREFILEMSIPEPNSGCWLWLGASRNGYGHFTRRQMTEDDQYSFSAHVTSYEVFTGKKIPKGKFGLHKCDNKLCVNPEHIEPGTNQENQIQCIERGGFNMRAKFSGDDIRKIRNDTRSQTAIAKEYGVHPSAINRIRHGKRWSHVK